MPENPPPRYFARLGAALDRAGIAEPVLVLDLKALDANAAAVADTLAAGPLGAQSVQRGAVRLVAKSLPCAPLLDRLGRRLGTRRHMVFNRPMLDDVLALDPGADILMGKPLHVAAAKAWYAAGGGRQTPGRGAQSQPQWLMDGPERVRDYAALARTLGLALRVNFEVDVGLHRGGFETPQALAAVLADLPAELIPCGLMGYDPHVAKLPRPLAARALARGMGLYADFAHVLRPHVPPGASATLNTAGSPTYLLHRDDATANEVAIGSAFVKPTAFDIPTLSHHAPACFIATPVLKTQVPARVPGLPPWAERLVAGRGRAVFIHGGNWQADPVHPTALRTGSIYGRSSNQERWGGRGAAGLAPGDWFFLRPWQSEATFLQFGPIAVYDGERISERWPVFPVST